MTNKIIIAAAAILIAFAAGFFLGRGNIRTSVKTEYVKGETVTKTVYVPHPTIVYVPKEYVLPTKPDTIYVDNHPYPIQTVDTTKIIQEYITQNTYEFNAFDDENGKLDIKEMVQYNRLQKFDYTFTPIKTIITKTTKPVFTPFVSASYNTFGEAGIGGGVFIKDIGVEYNYLYRPVDNQSGHMLGVKFKF